MFPMAHSTCWHRCQALLPSPRTSPSPSTALAGTRTRGPLNGTLEKVTTNVVDADKAWNAGYTGQGVTIALVDTGVAPR